MIWSINIVLLLVLSMKVALALEGFSYWKQQKFRFKIKLVLILTLFAGETCGDPDRAVGTIGTVGRTDRARAIEAELTGCTFLTRGRLGSAIVAIGTLLKYNHR